MNIKTNSTSSFDHFTNRQHPSIITTSPEIPLNIHPFQLQGIVGSCDPQLSIVGSSDLRSASVGPDDDALAQRLTKRAQTALNSHARAPVRQINPSCGGQGHYTLITRAGLVRNQQTSRVWRASAVQRKRRAINIPDVLHTVHSAQ